MAANGGGIGACVFDAYGTLFDTASAVKQAAEDFGGSGERLAALWRTKQLEYTWLRTIQGRYADFEQVTREALDYALEALGIRYDGLEERLMLSYLRLATYPEVPGVLAELKAAGVRTAILSNGTRAMLESAISHAGIGDWIDAVISVDEAGAFKPDARVYRLAEERLGLDRSGIAYQSANGWDAWAASAFGMRAVWCNRSGAPRERLPGSPWREVKTLAELPALVLAP